MLVKCVMVSFQWDIWAELKLAVFLVDQTPNHKPALNGSSGTYTRSGRLVKPPLSFWCGEREFVDQDLNVTIQKGGTDYLSMVSVLCTL